MQSIALEKEIFRLEKSYWQAMKENDVDTMLSLTGDPCIVAGPHGVKKVSKKDFLEMVKKPKNYQLQSFTLSDDYQVSVLNEDMAVIAYQVKESLDVEGEPVNIEATEASTWMRKNGQWTCSLHTESIIGDPFGRDRKTIVNQEVS